MPYPSATPIRLLLLTVLVLVLLGAALVQAQEATVDPPAQIVIEQPGLYPEGIEYDAAHDRFLVGSLSQGGVFSVTDDGTLTPFVIDPDLLASVGIHMDAAHNRLLVVSSDTRLFLDPTLPGFARLAAYDLESGERLFMTDLAALTDGGPHVANDVTVDADGNAYVTDTFAPIIYRVDPSGEASIFVEDERLAGEGGTPGLNGIDFHPDGFLLVPLMAQGLLYKVPVADPEALTEVALDRPLYGADGVTLLDDGRLVVVGGQAGTVYEVASDDGWATAVIERKSTLPAGVVATTAAVRDHIVYVVYAHLEAMMAGAPPPDAFEIVRTEFEPVLP